MAETFLKDVVQFNSVRNMLGFTGSYLGRRVSVMGTGMGMPSIGIYAHELIHFYGVKNLIRVGSCGAMQAHLKVRDIILGTAASTDSNFASQYGLPGYFAPTASWRLLQKALAAAQAKGIGVEGGNILSSDFFYDADPQAWRKWADMGVLAVEMEAAALYLTAAHAGVDALCILTVSDSLVSGEALPSQERESSFREMMELALALI